MKNDIFLLFQELRKKFAKMEMREAKHLSKIDELEKVGFCF